MQKTAINWTDRTWNPVSGCTKVSQGCKFCYAETIANRFWKNRKFTDIVLHEDRLEQPLHIKKPSKIFVNSMSDLFHEKVPFEFIDRVFETIEKCSQHTFQILTKRPERMDEYVTAWAPNIYHHTFKQLPNIWLGVSVEDQVTANKRIPLLLNTPAAVRWISAEPLLGQINLFNAGMTENSDIWPEGLLDWVVVGGESGVKARPMHPDWARSIRDQCKDANIPFFFKQWGTYITPEQMTELYYQHFEVNNSDRDGYFKVNKKKSGNLLDGLQHEEFPKVLNA